MYAYVSFILLSIFFTVQGCKSIQSYDLLIFGGTIYDGTGDTSFIADIAINGDRIVIVGELSREKAQRVIDAQGLAVAPGFIDIHAHVEPIMDLSGAESHVRQGVTTALGGPDGGGPWPFGAYLDSLETFPLGMNVAYLVGHNRIRSNVMQLARRAPIAEELEEMKLQVVQAMEAGAFGLSTGLKYLPGAFSQTDEVIELAQVASEYGGIYTSHIREEGPGLIEAVEEAIRIGDEADITAVLTHHKAMGKPMWGASERTLVMVDSARNKGIDIRIDQYPYTASYTGISVLIPSWAREGGRKVFMERLANPQLNDSIRAATMDIIYNERVGEELDRIQLARVSWKPEMEGKTLRDWVLSEGLEPTLEHGAKIVLDIESQGGASAIYHVMTDEDVDRIMLHPQTMIASDGSLADYGKGHPHPRWYGTFPRVLGYYVREKQLMPLETAIMKMTSMPADLMGLEDRGMLKEGMKADITLFDPETVIDHATFTEPHQYPEGILYVICNGILMIDQGNYQNRAAGRVLRGPAWKDNSE